MLASRRVEQRRGEQLLFGHPNWPTLPKYMLYSLSEPVSPARVVLAPKGREGQPRTDSLAI